MEVKGISIDAWPSKTVPGGVYVQIDTSQSDPETPLLIYMNDGQVWFGKASGEERGDHNG